MLLAYTLKKPAVEVLPSEGRFRRADPCLIQCKQNSVVQSSSEAAF